MNATYFVFSAYAGTPYRGHVEGTFAYRRAAESFKAILERDYEQRHPNPLQQHSVFRIATDRGHGPYTDSKPVQLTV